MRELVFALDYEPGCNAVADTLAEHPAARIRSLSLHATDESLWRVDHAAGSPDALAEIEEAFLTADYYADCLTTEDCGAAQTTQVLEHTDETLVLYSYWERAPTCSSVPHAALDHLGDGLLFETRHEEWRYTWRIIHSGDGEVRAFFDTLAAAVGGCAGLEIRRLTDASSPTTDAGGDGDSLPPDQAEALRAAIEHGYYETPRNVDAGELADLLGVPRSTLTYRLRRAEAYVAERWVDRTRSSGGPLSPL
ncbi:helix-turn-helix domain-containing protein [Halegenticoccus soli]|uniref:helix-turn-helix domain-containing protein n=1 Tax=Halegenticoccus soli TaxID=1985678 RepID=UPI000C6E30CD|nr:helix-turn-helix domain-containing protein [Halegenticoccus soli]